MGNKIHRKLWIGVIILSTAIAVLILYSRNQPITSWDSPCMLKIEEKWSSLWDGYYNKSPQDKAKYCETVEMSNDILRTHLTITDLRHLADTCGMIPIRSQERTHFQNSVLDYMTKTLTETGDRENLVKLLSTRVLDPLYYLNIELYLVKKYDKLSDPILILGEAYTNSRVPYTRRLIADALRRGFTSLGICGKDDDEFVRNAMQWYKDNKDHIVPNVHGYLVFPAQPFDIRDQMFRGNPPEPPYEELPPLFIEKSPPSKEKAEESQ